MNSTSPRRRFARATVAGIALTGLRAARLRFRAPVSIQGGFPLAPRRASGVSKVPALKIPRFPESSRHADAHLG